MSPSLLLRTAALAALLLAACGDPLGGRVGVSCPTGFTDCGGACYDLQADPLHCGACTTGCGAVQECQAGACQEICQVPGTTACGIRGLTLVCVDLQTSTLHCGACGNACGAGVPCAGGACGP